MMNSENNETILQMKNISKSFNTIQVLHDVNFEIRRGEVHALLGENGAGKSTLLNILTGSIKSDAGELFLNGNKIEVKNPAAARNFGIVRVHQELQLIPEMTVGQNIFLGREPKNHLKVIDFKEIYRKSDEILAKVDADFSSTDRICDLSTAQMQMVEISKALLQEFTVLALDEPTSSLTNNEIERLLQTIDNLRKQGKAIIYISHRMEEIFEIADRATVLRDGGVVGVVKVSDIKRPDLIKMMVGRDISEQRFNDTSYSKKEVALEVRELCGKAFKNINFILNKGEVLGFAGLVGAGRTEVVRAIFGIDKYNSGKIFVNSREVRIKNPKDAQKNGIMLIPEDRKLQGMVGILSNKANITLSNLNAYKKFGVLNHKKIKQKAKQNIEMLKVMPPDEEMATKNLSGGNQQKVVIARTMDVNPDIMILDEPTRGIDINVKFEIYKLIRNLAKEGKSVIMISSELPEIISLSDRVIVMYEGEIKGELSSSELTEESIMTYAMGGNTNGEN